MSVSANWFQVWFNSPYYHKLYFQRDENRTDLFIKKLIDRLTPPADSLLVDLACARGTHAKMMADMGYDVTGIDLAPESIDLAKEMENDKLHFYQHDLRLPFWINYFNYAFSLFSTFGYFRTEHEHYNAIRTISQSLKAGGVFVLDYLNVHYAENNLVHKQELEIAGVNYFITKWFDETHFYKKIIIEDENLKEPLEYIEKVSKFSLGDFTDMLAFHHLQIQEVFGSHDFAPYDVNKSPRLLMIAKKIV
ncbi:class I SAM-dependent methyltransferase [Flavitalea sp.]|nr:methyltransferase domain-containing protein [Flavitalea sp.]